MREKTKNKEVKLERTHGITLIALVITIIVLLILAAVSIAILTGQNGILSRANEAADETGRKKAEEKVAVEVLGSYGEDGNIDISRLNGNLENVEGLTSGLPIYKLPATVVVDGYNVTINVDGSVSSSKKETLALPSTANTKPFLPSGAEVIENDLEKGVVIKDSNGNEWTWIVVPKSEMPEKLTFENEENYTTLETALKEYVKNYRNSSYNDEWYDGCGLGEQEYNLLKQSMFKSVYENGGFYIGKYETGIKEDINRAYGTDYNTEHPINETPVIQQDKYVYNWVRCSQAQELSESLSTGERTSSLLFGIQWDLILKYLENERAVLTAELITDSSSWGNYSNADFSITKGKYSTDYGASYTDIEGIYNKLESQMLLTTGVTTRNSRMNIYDLAGNVYEWTLEKNLDSSYPCTRNGGVYNRDGSEDPVNYCSNTPTSLSNTGVGFRTALW